MQSTDIFIWTCITLLPRLDLDCLDWFEHVIYALRQYLGHIILLVPTYYSYKSMQCIFAYD